VRVHRFAEPKPGGIDKRITQIETFQLRYPDGSHNAEALLVTPKGDIFIVTKEEKADAGIYELKAPTRPGRHEMTKLGNIKLESGNAYSHMITGGDVAPDGKWVVLRTYFSVLLYQVENPADLATRRPTSLPAPFERQGEAICFDPKSKRLITTSEGMPCRVSEITLP
jgi:hypothetical protein